MAQKGIRGTPKKVSILFFDLDQILFLFLVTHVRLFDFFLPVLVEINTENDILSQILDQL